MNETLHMFKKGSNGNHQYRKKELLYLKNAMLVVFVVVVVGSVVSLLSLRLAFINPPNAPKDFESDVNV
jgi:hypothetical protein